LDDDILNETDAGLLRAAVSRMSGSSRGLLSENFPEYDDEFLVSNDRIDRSPAVWIAKKRTVNGLIFGVVVC
jgi:hypothetical protein